MNSLRCRPYSDHGAPSGHRIMRWRTGPPSPKPGLRTGPEIASAVLIQRRNHSAEGAVLAVALRAAASYRAKPAGGNSPAAGPHRSLTVLEAALPQAGSPSSGYRVSLAPFQLTRPASVPIQRVPSLAASRPGDGAAREMLTRWWLPGDAAVAIEAKQAEFRAEPKIAIRSLGNRVDIAFEEPFPNGPRGVRVLADVQRWVQRENATAARQQDNHRDGGSSVGPLHVCIHSISFDLADLINGLRARCSVLHLSKRFSLNRSFGVLDFGVCIAPNCSSTSRFLSRHLHLSGCLGKVK